MLKITYASQDEALARRIMSDLSGAGYQIAEADDTSGNSRDDVLIAIISADANADSTVQNQLFAALDNSQHVIPVLARPAEVPALINHLHVLDFSGSYDFAALRGAVDAALSPDTPRPLRVLTPAAKRTNRRAGVLLGALALFWFILGIYGVAVLGIQAPQEEYSAIDTQAAATQAFFINPELDRYGAFLPDSSDEAGSYEATLRAVPTVYRPFMAQTATSVGAGTPLATNDARTATPVPNTSGH
jgi:hypothetical protein